MRTGPIGTLLAAWLTATGFGQTLVEPHRIPAVKQLFESAPPGRQLRCQIHLVRPALDFAFRFAAGYTVDLPLAQLRGEVGSLTTFLKVTPRGGEPVYLTRTATVPRVPTAKGEAETSGTFAVGEGAYDVDVLVEDDRHESCRGSWQIEARRTGSERQIKTPAPGAPTIGSLTILLHASPLWPTHARLKPSDIRTFLDSLRSVLRDLPARSVRLVAFNLEQRAVIFRQDDFDNGHIGALEAALNQLKLGIVDYRTMLQNPEPQDLLLHLLQAEFQSPQPPDGIILLGPKISSHGNVPAGILGKLPDPAPAIFALEYFPAGRHYSRFAVGQRPYPMDQGHPANQGVLPPDTPPSDYGTAADGSPLQLVPDANMPDAIQHLMMRVKGETIPIRTPHDLADAIERMDRRIAKTTPAEPKAAPEPAAPPAAGRH